MSWSNKFKQSLLFILRRNRTNHFLERLSKYLKLKTKRSCDQSTYTRRSSHLWSERKKPSALMICALFLLSMNFSKNRSKNGILHFSF